METTKTKVGRKQKHHIDSRTGKPVVGLTRRPDGRWRIIGTHQTFREANEERAIDKFYAITNPIANSDLPEEEKQWLQTSASDIVDNNVVSSLARGFSLIIDSRKPSKEAIDEAWSRFWRYVGNEIQAKPKWCAKMSGIEELAYLKKLEPPTPVPTLAELTELWKKNYNRPGDEKRRVLTAWNDFVAHSDCVDIDDITPDSLRAYRNKVYARNIGAKYQQHIFNRIRRVLTFVKSEGVSMKEIAATLEIMELLTPNGEVTKHDPRPFGVDDWQKLYAATSGDDRAMICMMMNCALYLQEVVDLKWSDIKEGKYLVTHRKKKGRNVRVAVLWPETIAALAQVKKRGDFIFYSREGMPLDVSSATKRFRRMRKAAKVDRSVTASHFRDGAYTVAVKAGASQQLTKIFVGHSGSGVEDAYVKRDPEMVASVCEAVRRHYFT